MPALRTAEAIEQLERFGLTRYEATAFINLARLGIATASELAKAMGANRVQTYRALDSLEGRGLVEVTLERPKRYTPRALRDAFDLLIDERKRELTAMEQVKEMVVSAWPDVTGNRETTVRLQIIKGRLQIYRELKRAIREAKQEVLAFTTYKGIQRSYRAGIHEALLEVMGRGAKARVLVDLERATAPLFARVAAKMPLRHLEGQRGRFILIDRSMLFTFLIQDEKDLRGEGETALWTNSPDFVRAHLDIFERSWGGAVPADKRFRQLAGTGRVTAPGDAAARRNRRSTAGPDA